MKSPQPSSSSPTVLVVDDEEPLRRFARRILEENGYHVRDVASGEDAVAFIDSGAPLDLLMADLDMPGMGGIEMARQIRVARPDLKVLYVTGNIDRLMDDRPVLWEGESYLDKPFSPAGLAEAVSMSLQGTIEKRT